MKHSHILTTILLFATVAYNNTPADNTTSDNSEKTIDALYHFAETTDKDFCNPDSIIPSDCGGGDLYFTKNSNVVYTYFCNGTDTTSYDIGKYSMTENEISCTFNRSYSFYNGYSDMDEPKPYDPNSGTIKDSKTWRLELKKTECDKFVYYFLSDNQKEKYVLKNTDKEHSKYFLDDFKKVKVLVDL